MQGSGKRDLRPLIDELYNKISSAEGPSTTALSQPVWFIDPVNGNDSNDGATSGTALKTWAQLNHRFGVGNLLTPTPLTSTTVGDLPVTTINLLSSLLPPSDPMDLNVALQMGALIHVVGGWTVARSGIVGPAPIAQNPAGNVRCLIADAAAGPTDLNNIIQFTSGIASGAFCWVAKTGVGTLTLSDIQNVSEFPVATYPGQAAPAPSVGDTYNVLSLTQATLGAITISYQGNPSVAEVTDYQPGGIYFDLVHCPVSSGGQGGWSMFAPDSVGAAFNRCKIDNSINWFGGQLLGLNSGWFGQGDQTNGGITFVDNGSVNAFLGGLINCSPGFPGSFIVPAITVKGGRTVFDGNVMLEGTVLTSQVHGSAFLSYLSVFDATLGISGPFIVDLVGAVTILGNAFVVPQQAGAAASLLWGSGNAGVGVAVPQGGSCGFFSAPFFAKQPVIAGAGGTGINDFSVGADIGVATSNSVFGFDLVTGLYVGPTSCAEWGNLFSPLGAGTGFGGNAINPKKLALIGNA